MNPNLYYWSLYRALRVYLGEKVNEHLQIACRYFYYSQSSPRLCSICGKHIRHGNRSVDHIIPLSVVRELELYRLMFDPRNMRIAHNYCNVNRGNDISDLPESVINKLASLGYTV